MSQDLIDQPLSDVEPEIAAIARIAAVPRILDVVCQTTGMGFAAVARVTTDRWVACSVRDDIKFGLRPGDELKVETTICDEIRLSGQPVVIDHVAEDAVFRGHPTPAMYGFQSYISMPIVLSDGTFFGTLCAIDPKPAKVSAPATVGMFKLFAELIAFHLDASDKLAAPEARGVAVDRKLAASDARGRVADRKLALSEAVVLEQKSEGELREQFIAVLGHDLRNPLAAIEAGVRLLARDPPPERAKYLIEQMRKSIGRMSELINNVLEFARGRLGGGLLLKRDADAELQPALEQVIAELQATAPDRVIEAEFSLASPVDCDPSRIAQMLSNLLGNALSHGATDAPIRIRVASAGPDFSMSVSNKGTPIQPDVIPQLFRPFFRAARQTEQEGLGLGLYIAAEIARAHEGDLTVFSTEEETRFTFHMPAQ